MALVLALNAASTGIGGVLIFASLAAILTGLYVAVTGRRSWARLAGRRMGAGALAAGVILMFVGGGVYGAAHPQDRVSTASDNTTAATVSGSADSSSPLVTASPTATTTTTATATASASATTTPDVEPGDPSTVPVVAKAAAPKAQPAYATKAIDLLAKLPVKGRAPKTGYSRDQFGQAWADVDHNGCDTRNDVLHRDLKSLTLKPGTHSCVVLKGTLNDPYTTKTIAFTRGQQTSLAVQIDHVVALSNAWQTGAQKLTLAQRTALANDPLNLLAVDGPTNGQKSDGDAATWLPPNKAYRCSYVARQISVKATYGLWVTQPEHDAMARILGNCAGTVVPTNQKAIVPVPVQKSSPAPAPAQAAPAPVRAAPAPVQAAPAPAPVRAAPAPVQAAPAPAPVVAAPVQPAAPAPSSVYYQNCTAVRAAGHAPLYAGQPGYSSKLDRDGDGVACE